VSLADALAAANGAPPRFVDIRFDAAKRPVRCSGNTVVCHRRDAAGRAAIADLAAKIAEGPAGDCYAFTPERSWHMTVYDGLLHDRRAPGFWPADLPVDASNDQADAFVLSRLADLPALDEPVTMHATGLFGREHHALGLALAAGSARQERALRRFRDACAERLGMADRPGHDAYRFHLTLGYLIAWPDPATARAADSAMDALAPRLDDLVPPFELGPPELCLFDDMTLFRPV